MKPEKKITTYSLAVVTLKWETRRVEGTLPELEPFLVEYAAHLDSDPRWRTSWFMA
jgi:hypothetical protein